MFATGYIYIYIYNIYIYIYILFPDYSTLNGRNIFYFCSYIIHIIAKSRTLKYLKETVLSV